MKRISFHTTATTNTVTTIITTTTTTTTTTAATTTTTTTAAGARGREVAAQQHVRVLPAPAHSQVQPLPPPVTQVALQANVVALLACQWR
jgi:hypothetical protein